MGSPSGEGSNNHWGWIKALLVKVLLYKGMKKYQFAKISIYLDVYIIL